MCRVTVKKTVVTAEGAAFQPINWLPAATQGSVVSEREGLRVRVRKENGKFLPLSLSSFEVLVHCRLRGNYASSVPRMSGNETKTDSDFPAFRTFLVHLSLFV